MRQFCSARKRATECELDFDRFFFFFKKVTRNSFYLKYFPFIWNIDDVTYIQLDEMKSSLQGGQLGTYSVTLTPAG